MLLIRNKDADSTSYESTKNLYRPGHANYTYLEKYGIFDYRGEEGRLREKPLPELQPVALLKNSFPILISNAAAFVAEIGGDCDL